MSIPIVTPFGWNEAISRLVAVHNTVSDQSLQATPDLRREWQSYSAALRTWMERMAMFPPIIPLPGLPVPIVVPSIWNELVAWDTGVREFSRRMPSPPPALPPAPDQPGLFEEPPARRAGEGMPLFVWGVLLVGGVVAVGYAARAFGGARGPLSEAA